MGYRTESEAWAAERTRIAERRTMFAADVLPILRMAASLGALCGAGALVVKLAEGVAR